MDVTFEAVTEAAGFIRREAGLSQPPDLAIVLGSGLGGFRAVLQAAREIEYAAIPYWPRPGVSGHAGTLAIGRCGDRLVAALAGRAHVYEGHDFATVTFATRVVGRLGVPVLILTSAVGGINPGLHPGDLLVIDDHINLMGGNPLVGPNDERFGPRFPDMTAIYSARLRRVADEAAAALGTALPHGVYAGLCGPSYETPAEIRYLRTIGADVVGMSTVPEAIVARHMGLEVLGLSCVSNMAAGARPQPLSHQEVLETTEGVQDRFIALLEEVIRRV